MSGSSGSVSDEKVHEVHAWYMAEPGRTIPDIVEHWGASKWIWRARFTALGLPRKPPGYSPWMDGRRKQARSAASKRAAEVDLECEREVEEHRRKAAELEDARIRRRRAEGFVLKSQTWPGEI